MPDARCTRSLVRVGSVECTRVFPAVAPKSPGIPARNGFNGFLRALPGDEFLLPPSSTDMFLSAPGRADATPPTGHQQRVPGPHDFAVRISAVRLACR